MPVLRCAQVVQESLADLLDRFGLSFVQVHPDCPIPGSYWGEPEAGLVLDRIYARADTPVHSVLHEACHWICMDGRRRSDLHTDAGGDDAEENAVCYLQVLLADLVPGFGRRRLFADMDAWGYSFRLGSAQVWFERDSQDARRWLLEAGLIDPQGRPRLRPRP